MKLLLVTTSYPDDNEGAAAAGSFVADFAHALVTHGAETTIVAPAAVDGTECAGGLEVRRFAAPRLPLSLLNPVHPMDWPAILSTLCAGQKAVYSACKARRFDHVLALWTLPCGWWAMRAGARYGMPYSTWALGSDIWSLGRVPVVRSILGRVLRQASMRFADGLGLCEDVERLCGLPCSFLPSSRQLAPAPERAPREAPPWRLAFLGRFHRNKGIDLLLDALEMLAEADWARIDAIRINGGGPMEQEVANAVAKLVSAGRPIRLGGYLDRDGARELLDWTDWLVIPSRIESIPVVFSDAVRMGRPVVATPVGDLPRLLGGAHACGVLAENADAQGIAVAIRHALRCVPADYLRGLAEMAAAFDTGGAAKAFLDATAHSVNSISRR